MKRTPRRGGLYAILLLAAHGLVGCATLSEPVFRTDRTLVASYDEKRESEGEVVVRQSRWAESRLLATIERQELCQPLRRDVFATQKVGTVTADGVGLSVVGGLVGLAGGVALGAASSSFSDTPGFDPETGKQIMSPRSTALAFAVLGVLGGVFSLGNAIWAVSGAGEVKVGELGRHEEEVVTGPIAECGGSSPPQGTLVVEGGGRVVARSPRTTGKVSFDLEKATDVCRQEALLGKVLTVSYVATGLKLGLGQRDISDCVRAEAASVRLRRARALTEAAASPQELALAGPVAASAEEFVKTLGETSPRRAELVAGLAEEKAARAQASERMLARAMSQFEAAVSEGLLTAVDAGLTALVLADAVPGKQRPTWAGVVAGLGGMAVRERELGTVVAMFLDRHEPTRRCLGNATECPEWLQREAIVAAFRVVTDRARAFIAEAAARLGRLTTAVGRKAQAQEYDELSQFVATEGALREICRRLIFDASVMAACEATNEPYALARKTLEAVAEKRRAAQIASTAAAWKAIFPKCRKVAEGYEAFSGLERCDAGCQTAMARVEEDRSTLSSFVVESPAWSAETLAAVRTLCTTARCPVCP